MTILCDRDLLALMQDGLIQNPDYSLLNPASIDIRIGRNAVIEIGEGEFRKVLIPESGMELTPGQFCLVDTWESFNVPNGYAMDLRLKSSTARKGFNHLLAFWVDPGWRGVLTMEIKNELQHNTLLLKPAVKFAQVIVHKLSGESQVSYTGRYQGAESVQQAKG